MAKPNVTRDGDGFKSTLPSTLLPLARDLGTALSELTKAERAPGAIDDAVSAARDHVLTRVAALILLPIVDLKFYCVQRAAALVQTVMLSQDTEEVAAIRTSIATSRWVWQVPVHMADHLLYNDAVDAILDALAAHIDLSAPPPAPQGPATAQASAPSRAMAPAQDLPAPVAHSTVSQAFTAMLRQLDACTAAERLLQRTVVSDVFAHAFADDLKEAEIARQELHDLAEHLIGLRDERALDRSLRLLAVLLQTLLSVEDDGDRRHIHGTLERNAHLLEVPSGHPSARMVRALQRHFFKSCAALMGLQDFGGPGPDEDNAGGPLIAA